jgi:hypothetical protein
MAKVQKRIQDTKFEFCSLDGQDLCKKLSSGSKRHDVFAKMMAVLLLLCLMYIPIIHALSGAESMYPGYLH